MTKPITKFRGQYFFLSNFFPAVVHHEGFTYATAEHAYQASKFMHVSERVLIQNQPTAALAKQVGQKVTGHSNFSESAGNAHRFEIPN